MNKITCICLGVKDMEKSIKFYRDGLGYKTDCKENNPAVCFFDTPGTKFELFAKKIIRRYVFLILREQSSNYFLWNN